MTSLHWWESLTTYADVREVSSAVFLRDEWTSLTSTSSSGADEWLAFIDRLGSMEDTFVSGVRKLTARVLSISAGRSMEFHGYLYRHFNARDLSSLYVRDGRGQGTLDRFSGSSGPVCASARSTRIYDDHVRHRAGPRSRREFLAISITYTHTWLQCFFSFSSSASFYFFLLLRASSLLLADVQWSREHCIKLRDARRSISNGRKLYPDTGRLKPFNYF